MSGHAVWFGTARSGYQAKIKLYAEIAHPNSSTPAMNGITDCMFVWDYPINDLSNANTPNGNPNGAIRVNFNYFPAKFAVFSPTRARECAIAIPPNQPYGPEQIFIGF